MTLKPVHVYAPVVWRCSSAPGHPCGILLQPSLPEEALAALTGHGVEVEACGLVSTHTADARHIPVKLIRGQSGGAHSRGFHH